MSTFGITIAQLDQKEQCDAQMCSHDGTQDLNQSLFPHINLWLDIDPEQISFVQPNGRKLIDLELLSSQRSVCEK